MEQGIEPGDEGLVDLERRAWHSERVRTTEAVQRGGRTSLTLIDVANHGTQIAEEAVRQAKRVVPPPGLACKAGCDWCCHLTVGTSVAEVVRILEYVRQTLSAEELVALRERVVRLDEERRAAKALGRSAAGVACALLVEHRCLAYPVRPLMCGGFNSRDAGECERFVRSSAGTTAVPGYAPQVRLAAFVLDGMNAGLSESGLRGERVELTAALRIALETPEAVERFLAGEAVFAEAEMD